MKPLLIIAVLLLALVGVFLFLATSDTVQAGIDANPAPARAASMGRGDRGVLLTPTRDLAIVGRTQGDLEDLLTFAAAKDFHGIAQMADAERAYLVEPRTQVLVIETSGQTARVRLLDGPLAGRDGWTAREWVQP